MTKSEQPNPFRTVGASSSLLTMEQQGNAERIRKTAAHYVTRLYSGELSAHEELQLQTWRNKRAEHEQALQEMLALWELSNNLYQPVGQTRSLRRRLRSWSISAAAGVALSVGVVYLMDNNQPASHVAQPTLVTQVTAKQAPETVPNAQKDQRVVGAPTVRQEHRYLRTGLGEVDTIALSDGSTVTLNTGTVLQIAFNKEERFVVLVQGEAFFAVESDINRPFVIDTGEQEIRVLGTKFNVRKEESGVRVAVIEGKVAVTRVSSLPSADSLNDSHEMTFNAEDYLLEAGAVGSFSATADVIANSDFARVSEAQSWRRGIFRFDNSSLEDVVKEFNRYRSLKIRIEDTTAADLRISGVFHFNDGEGLLQALTASLPIELEEAEHEVLIRKAP